MRLNFSDRTYMMVLFRDLLQAIADERRSLKSVITEIDIAIAERRRREEGAA